MSVLVFVRSALMSLQFSFVSFCVHARNISMSFMDVVLLLKVHFWQYLKNF